MSALFDLGSTIAELQAIANFIGGPAAAAEDIKIASDSLRLVSDSLLDCANELARSVRGALNPQIAERAEREPTLAAAKAELSDAPASHGTMLLRHADEDSAVPAIPIVVMAANLRWT
jgi:hypothetical protein